MLYPSQARVSRWFLLTSAVVLLLTSVPKLATVFFVHSVAIDKQDVLLFFLTSRQVLSFAAVFELLSVVVLMSPRLPQAAKLSYVACLASGFLAYRLMHYYGTGGKPCGCLGQLFYFLPAVTPKIASHISAALLGFLFVGSNALLLSQSPGKPTSELRVKYDGKITQPSTEH